MQSIDPMTSRETNEYRDEPVDVPGEPGAVQSKTTDKPVFGFRSIRRRLDLLSDIQLRELLIVLTEKEPTFMFDILQESEVRLNHAQALGCNSMPSIDIEYMELELNRVIVSNALSHTISFCEQGPTDFRDCA